MKTLHLYLIRQVLATLMMTVFVFTFVLLLGNGIREILPMLISHQVSFGLAVKAVALLIPYVLAFALPIGMLTAALLVFGRFSADQELIAVRASGVSLVSLVTPILALSVVLSLFCGWLNCEVAPRSRVAFHRLLSGAGVIRANHLLRSGQYVTLDHYSVYAGKISSDGSQLENVWISVNDTNGDTMLWALAPRGTLVMNPTNNQEMVLSLEDACVAVRRADGFQSAWNSGSFTYPIDLRPKSAKSNEDEIPTSDMTFRQLWRRLDQIESLSRLPLPAKDQTQAFADQMKAMKSNMTSLLVNLHRQVSFSFACIGFTLIGIPLGIRAHRRETSVGMAMALVLVLVYYSFLILGDAWSTHPERAPHLIVWLPNFIFQAVGCVLLFRANRQG